MEQKELPKILVNMLGDRVLIIPDDAEEKTAGGIIVPDTVKEKPKKGTVMLVGRGSWDDELLKRIHEIQPGDKVVYSKYAGTELKINGTDYVILRESDVMFNYDPSVNITLNY